MTELFIINGDQCPECYRRLQKTNVGMICRRCGHNWDKIVEPELKAGITDKQERE